MKLNGKGKVSHNVSTKGGSRVAQTGTVAAGAVSDDLPFQDDIAVLAYCYWEARGCRDGSPEEDWFRAERELRGARSQQTN
jgi:hypothetical protein